jgi:hypothetical protein
MSYAGYELWPVGTLRRAPFSRRFVQLGDVFVAPTTPPPFSFSIPDGKGGWTTVGTLPPPPATSKLTAGPSPEVINWVQVGAAAAGGVVALATLYFMLKTKGKAR